MFGYVRPLKSELRVREFEQFKAGYCALCHALSDGYGLPARFILNYDFLFLAMLTWDLDCHISFEKRRCIVSPFRKKTCCRTNAELRETGAFSVVLTHWKLIDSIRDDGFIRSLGSRLAMLALRRSYSLAKKHSPEFDATVEKRLSELTALEIAGETSLDRTADEFATLLTAAIPSASTESDARALKQILYHTGRWIYIIDAVNDLSEDRKRGVYNPVAARFRLEGDRLSEDDEKTLRITLDNSLGLIRSAFELMPDNDWADIIRNIIYFGMPAVSEAVFSGNFHNGRDGLPR